MTETKLKIRNESGNGPGDCIGICHRASFGWCSPPGVLPKIADGLEE